jgi:hypothetical protein
MRLEALHPSTEAKKDHQLMTYRVLITDALLSLGYEVIKAVNGVEGVLRRG